MAEKTSSSLLQYVKGIGPKRAVLYEKLGVDTPDALLRHYPRRYIDVTHPLSVADATYGESVAVKARVYQKLPTRRISKGRQIAKALVHDGMHSMAMVFFNTPYACDGLEIGEEYVFYGRVGGSLAMKEMVNPLIVKAEEATALMPVYRLTKGLSNKQIAKNVATVLKSHPLTETLPADILCAQDFPSLAEAVAQVHFPKDAVCLAKARKRLIFEELLVLQLALVSFRKERTKNSHLIAADMAPFYAALPFSLTNAQQKALSDCLADLGGKSCMSRLVQGDVGSGKTMVAAGCAYAAARCKIQTALMVPTEILAIQHHQTLSKTLEPLGLRVGLLTGSLPKAEKEETLRGLASGEIDLVIGTHALLQPRVHFANLGLVVTDEQHRFGVEQRRLMAEKGESPHVLVMSATPIPRSLALVIYGDLDVSVIDELPAGRKPVKTYLVDSGKRQRMYGFLNRLMEEGQQGFIVCPAIESEEEEDDPTLENVQDYAKKVANSVFLQHKSAVLHGKLRPAEKESIMASFAAGETKLLFTTTVVEVGVDVPAATFMVIENAERFGLSQMHQLRGRVGRGQMESHCILVSDDQNELTRHRLKTLCQTTDGFALASEDLKMRGPGDFFGSRQHGLPQMQIADLMQDMQMVELAKAAAEKLLVEGYSHLPALEAEVALLVQKLGAGSIS